MWLLAPPQDNQHVIQLAKILTNVRHHIHKVCVCVCVCPYLHPQVSVA